ncbi:MAG TPA: SRPBCC family protein [Polyangiaceae bacterium]
MSEVSSNSIKKKVVLSAAKARVWRALSDSAEFGEWFRLKLEGPFREGATVRGRITHPGYEHVTVELQVEKVEPERYFAYRWHPYATDTKLDYSAEPTTHVEFQLEEAKGGTLLTITESGFDRIPAGRRAEAFRMNDGGWTAQAENIRKHVTAA